MIIIPTTTWEHGKIIFDDAKQSDDRQDVIWQHCFDALPDNFKSGAWVNKSGRRWMQILLNAHGADFEAGVLV